MILALVILVSIIAIIGIIYFRKKKEVEEIKPQKPEPELSREKVTPILAAKANIIKGILNTEKTRGLKQKENKYTFVVDRNANKIEIMKAVESLYKVKAMKINTLIMHGKKRRVRYEVGKRPDWKKAIATLRIGDRIESLE